MVIAVPDPCVNCDTGIDGSAYEENCDDDAHRLPRASSGCQS